MRDAIRIILAKSQNAASAAMACKKSLDAKSPVAKTRYETAARVALSDPQAGFTADERALIASYLMADEEPIKPRNVRLNDADWALAAEIGGGDATAGIRRALREYKG